MKTKTKEKQVEGVVGQLQPKLLPCPVPDAVVVAGSISASARIEKSAVAPAARLDDATPIASGQSLQKSDDDGGAAAGRAFGSFAGLVRNGTGKRNYGEKPALKVIAFSCLLTSGRQESPAGRAARAGRGSH